MRNLLLFVVGGLLMMGEGVVLWLLGLQSGALYLSVTCMVFLALNRSTSHGCAIAIAWLALAEWCAMGRTGVLSVGLVAVFLVASIFKGRLEQRWGTPHLLLVGAGVVMCHLSALVLSGVLATSGQWGGAILLSLARALIGALVCGLPFGRLLLAMERRTGSNKHDLGLLR